MAGGQGDVILLVDVVAVDGRPALRLAGELDLEGTEKVLAAARRVFRDARTTTVVIDVADLAFCDSSGIRVLCQVEHEAAVLGRTVVLRSPTTIVRRVLELTGVSHLLNVVPLNAA